ncbi:hypothetical protein LB505_006287 [Fusarium chuoi]|nr:hypothetical protein LB505_006287 [Fusarium chuoi]
MLGPVLDVLNNARYQPLGVRATGDDPQEVSQYGLAALRGIRDAGIASCGKHFPSYGNLNFLGSNLDVPIITQTLEELSISALLWMSSFAMSLGSTESQSQSAWRWRLSVMNLVSRMVLSWPSKQAVILSSSAVPMTSSLKLSKA